MEYDVVVIGAGVVGSAIARELSRYKLQIALLEKEADVAAGASRANSGIVHAGFDPKPGTLKAILNVRGNRLMEPLCEELKVPFKRIGSLVIGRRKGDLDVLNDLLERGKRNGINDLRIVMGDELREMEPNITPDATAALYAPGAGIVCPYSLTIALAENAAVNGVKVMLGTAARGIEVDNGRVAGVITDQGLIRCNWVINCAGVWSDQVASWVGEPGFTIQGYRGEYCLLDKKVGNLVRHVVFPLPTDKTKGILVSPTVSGNVLVGPNRTLVEDREDRSTTRSGLMEVLEGARSMISGIREKDIIATFAGVRAVADTGEFEIGPFGKKGFINVAGIQSPGLTAAPAIAEMVVDILKEEGLALQPRPDFKPEREPVFRFIYASNEERQAAVKKNRLYGEIVCRCESVTAGEILDAIEGPLGARTLDAIKRRTRAGMGRCQGGFCSPRIIHLMSRHLGVAPDVISKDGPGSEMVISR